MGAQLVRQNRTIHSSKDYFKRSVVIEVYVSKVLRVIIVVLLSGSSLEVKSLSALLLTLILEHLFMSLLELEAYLEGALRKRSLGLDHVVVIAVRAVLISLFKLFHLLPKALLAFLTEHDDFSGSHELVGFGVARFRSILVLMAVRTIEPLLAARGTDHDLSVENMLAH